MNHARPELWRLSWPRANTEFISRRFWRREEVKRSGIQGRVLLCSQVEIKKDASSIYSKYLQANKSCNADEIFYLIGKNKKMTDKTIISVHIPKTAGSSFKKILEAYFEDKILFDYEDAPINTPPFFRKYKALKDSFLTPKRLHGNARCIHGHFMPYKYSRLDRNKTLFVTWLRNPLERMISHYKYWIRTYTPQSPRLHRKIVEEKWSLEDFCFSPATRNFYAQFLWSFPLELFDFIGITESFDEDLQVFGQKFLSKEALKSESENVAPPEAARFSPSESFRVRFEDFHAEDYRMYRKTFIQRQRPAPPVPH